MEVARLKDFINRVLRLKDEQDAKRPFPIIGAYAVADCAHRDHLVLPSGCRRKEGVYIQDAANILDICGRLTWAGRASSDFHEDRMGFTIACRLTGLSWLHVQYATSHARRFGPYKAAYEWAPFMAAPDPRVIGFVYSATSHARPGLVKVGFSRNPVKRMRSLSRSIGHEVSLQSYVPGTLLHEWAIHQIIFRQPFSEWHHAEDVPGWLFNELSERQAA